MTDRPSIEQRVIWTRGLRYADHLVLRALARWYAFRADGTRICPRSVPELWRKVEGLDSSVSFRTVERALARLVNNRYLRKTDAGNRQPTTYAIDLSRLADRDPDQLRGVDRPDSQRFDRQNGGRDPTSTAKVAAEIDFDRQNGGRTDLESHKNRPVLEKVADEKSALCTCTNSTEYVRTTSSTTEEDLGTSTRSADSLSVDVQQFRTWWAAQYPAHNHGATNVITPRDAAVVWELLEYQSVEELQALALALWADTVDAWIASRADRGIRVLRHKANYLAGVIADVAAPPAQLRLGLMTDTSPSVDAAPIAANVWTQALARIEPKLDRRTFHTWLIDTVLVADRGAVIEVAKPGPLTAAATDWIPKHYGGIVRDAVDAVRPGTTVAFVAVDESRRPDRRTAIR